MSDSQVPPMPPLPPIAEAPRPAPVVLSENEARNWAMFSHLGIFVGYVVPFGNFLAPLIILVTKGKEHELVRDQATESLNFQITMFIATFVCLITIVGWLCLLPLAIFDIVVTIVAAVAANRGEKYRYPFCLRLIT